VAEGRTHVVYMCQRQRCQRSDTHRETHKQFEKLTPRGWLGATRGSGSVVFGVWNRGDPAS
jgi:hypothetical protein